MKLVVSIASVGTVGVELEKKEMTRLDRLNRGSPCPLTSLPSLTSAPLASLEVKSKSSSQRHHLHNQGGDRFYFENKRQRKAIEHRVWYQDISPALHIADHDSRCKAPHLLPCCRRFWNNQVRVLRNNIILKKKINFSGCKLCRDQQERQVYLGNSGTVLPQYGINQFGRLIILPDNVLTWTSCTLLRRLHMCVLTRVPTTITGYPSTIGSAHLL